MPDPAGPAGTPLSPSPPKVSLASNSPEILPESWQKYLKAELIRLAENHQLRCLRTLTSQGPTVELAGRRLVNLASNDYLALAGHPWLIRAAQRAAARYGVGAGASPLVAGHLRLHARLEREFALFKKAQAALLFPTGYMANLAALTALAGPGDVIFMDKLCHASLIDAARASGATLRVFPHLGYDKLQRLLERHRQRHHTAGTRMLIVTDSVFSMDGDCADLPALCRLAREYEALLIVDEAHATGLLGPDGSGLAAHQGVAGQIHLTISTASKALGGLGGIVSGPQLLIDTLINRARPFIFSTAPPPPQVAVIRAALHLIRRDPQRRVKLTELTTYLRSGLAEVLPASALPAHIRQNVLPAVPIIPVLVGLPQRALELAAYLQERGFFAPAIRPPAVPPGQARIRLSLRADLDRTDLDRLVQVLVDWPGWKA